MHYYNARLLLLIVYNIILFGSIQTYHLKKHGGDSGTSTQQQYQQDVLKAHNKYRAKHCVSALKLKDEISQSAQAYAEHLAKIDQLEHSDGSKGYGENLYWTWNSEEIKNFTDIDATSSWYEEIKDYDYDKPGFSMDTGHFTQVVWKNTASIGVGIALTKDGQSAYVVVQYSPAGNYEGQYKENVLKANC